MVSCAHVELVEHSRRDDFWRKSVCPIGGKRYSQTMSKAAEAVLQEFQKLPPAEQQGVLQQLLCLFAPVPQRTNHPIPTVKVTGGRITSDQVAETIDDE